MTEEAIQARREYQRKYYAAHKEERKEHNARYWERKAAREREKEGKSGKVVNE